MSRSVRSTIAQDTLRICEAGRYTLPNGQEVSLESAIHGAVSGTALVAPQEIDHLTHPTSNMPTQIEVTDETTIEAIRRLARANGGHLACLNFASAKNPGGGFLGGSQAQEESLARSSALYPCLLAAPEFYERNRASRTALYLDLAIWSPGVPFFRDDSGALLDEPVVASVITAPAPNAGAVAANEPTRLPDVAPVLKRRAEFVLALAASRGVKRLILGAWGCGVFRNDPQTVARLFAELLRDAGPYSNLFEHVAFAIYDRTEGRTVMKPFAQALT